MADREHLKRQAWHMFHAHRGLYITSNGLLGENPAGAQCVNVPNTYWARCGLQGQYGNAVDWAGRDMPGREWLPMTERLRLEVGDVAVFRPEFVGPNGHVDVVLDGSRSPFAGMDQNWPLGSPISEQWHFRILVAGVQRIR